MSESKIELVAGTICISGNLDFETVMSIWQQSLPLLASCSELKFDFSTVNHANSSALALLLEWVKYAKKNRKPLVFKGLDAHLRTLTSIVGIDNWIPMQNFV